MTREELKDIGFVELPHQTVMNALEYDLGRNRFLSVGSAGTPNEMIFIIEVNNINPKKVDNLVVLHNYDYDGYATIEKVKALISAIVYKK